MMMIMMMMSYQDSFQLFMCTCHILLIKFCVNTVLKCVANKAALCHLEQSMSSNSQPVSVGRDMIWQTHLVGVDCVVMLLSYSILAISLQRSYRSGKTGKCQGICVVREM